MPDEIDEPPPGDDHLDALGQLEAELGYDFDDRELLRRALTHRSFLPEQDEVEADNQRLEFLGDAVLGLAVSDVLFRHDREVDEGALSKRLARVVRRSALADAARSIELGAYIRMGKGEVLSGGRDRDSVLADAFEAVLAAIYLDGGFEEAHRVVGELQESAMAEAVRSDRPSDSKSCLQEATQRDAGVQPDYRVVDESGPEHDKTFVAEVAVDGEVLGEGSGGAKQQAEQRAASVALEVWRNRHESSDGGEP